MQAILRGLVPRLFVLGLLIGAGVSTLVADGYKCPDCYGCRGGCSIGTNVYGFDDCAFINGSCSPNGGSPCCEGEEDPPLPEG